MTQPQSPTSLSRRRALQLFGVGGTAALVSACAGPGSTSGGDDAPEESALDADGPIEGTISFAHWRAEDQSVLADIISGLGYPVSFA